MTKQDKAWYKNYLERRTMKIGFSDQLSLVEMHGRLVKPHQGPITFRLLVRIQKNLDEIYKIIT